MSDSKIRVAVLGGGMAALACAYRLSDPAFASRFEITVYQMGWRLGGKGASGRNPSCADRIEEHGLHVWMGFYHDAFRLMRDVYEELGQRKLRAADAPLARWDQAFTPHDLIVVAEDLRSGWDFWRFPFPRNDERPGDTGTGRWPKPASYVQMSADLLGRGARALARALTPRALSSTLPRAVQCGVELGRAALERDAEPLAEQLECYPELRRWLVFLEFLRVNLRGLARDRGVTLDELDELDYREWLAKHGAGPLLLDSAGLRGMYDMSFAYLDGDLDQPDFAAGVFLRFFARMFLGYKGAVFWKMQGGMGDVVFAPLYEVLRARGVRFEFFHRVDELALGVDESGGQVVDRIHLTRQAVVRDSSYEPLVDVGGLPCWPSEPLWEQLADAPARRADGNLESANTAGADQPVVLQRGRDFDEVVLGISIAALPRICAEFLERNPAFASMCREVKTTATQAAQLWLDRSAAELGWATEPCILDAYGGAMNTWADMTNLRERESWRPGTVGHIAYFCGPLQPGAYADPEAPSAAELTRDRDAVFADFAEFARTEIGGLWPNATDGGEALRWDWLVAPEQLEGEARLAHQYVRANTEPTERYVLSSRGATAHRLRPHETGARNLVFAGDWTRTTLNYGCIEGAVQSGLEAATALKVRASRRGARVVGTITPHRRVAAEAS
jgi:uncharacterized protein with NAD-binding domain and iron-sulfur cluster